MTSETTPENPAAFPMTGEGFSSPQYSQYGMTLRDYFAGQALAGMGTWMPLSASNPMLVGAKSLQARAAWAYDQADAMLTARKGPDHGRG
jgi:hypothetical protein